MKLTAAGVIYSSAMVLTVGLAQIAAFMEYGGAQEDLRLHPNVFYSPIFGLLSVGFSILSMFLVMKTGSHLGIYSNRSVKAVAAIWVGMIVVLFLTVISIFSLLFGWAVAT